jgi:hypothetical protein
MTTPETKLKLQIKHYLSYRQAFWWTNLQGLGSFKGVPDICALKDNKLYLIEAKSKKGKLSEHQKKFMEQAVDVCPQTVVAIVAYSLDDVMTYL